MHQLAWITSYPQSGCNLAWSLVTGYLVDTPPTEVTSDALLDVAPDLVTLLSAGRTVPLGDTRPYVVKTQLLPGVDIVRHCQEATGKIVYVVRDPRTLIATSVRATPPRKDPAQTAGPRSPASPRRTRHPRATAAGASTSATGRRRSGSAGTSRTSPVSTSYGSRTWTATRPPACTSSSTSSTSPAGPTPTGSGERSGPGPPTPSATPYWTRACRVSPPSATTAHPARRPHDPLRTSAGRSRARTGNSCARTPNSPPS